MKGTPEEADKEFLASLETSTKLRRMKSPGTASRGGKMTTPKLSDAQRTQIRSEMKKRVAGGDSTAEIVNSFAKKYSISTATARYYLKSIVGKNGTPRKAEKAAPRPSRNGHASGLRKLAETLTTADLKRIVAAQAVLPKLEAAQKRRAALEEQADRIQKDLKAAERTAEQLERRVKSLTGL